MYMLAELNAIKTRRQMLDFNTELDINHNLFLTVLGVSFSQKIFC